MEIRKDITFRFGVVYFVAVIVGLIIVIRIFLIQTMDTDKWKKIARDLKNNTTKIAAKRGNLLADDGSILATSVPYYELRMDLAAPRIKQVFSDQVDVFSEAMAHFFGISRYSFEQRLKMAYRKGDRWFLLAPDKVNYLKLQQFKQQDIMSSRLFGAGLIVVGDSKRVLPHDDMASRTIGTLNRGAYGGIHGNVGYSGIEGKMEGYLAGEKGLAIKHNYSGHWVNIPIREPKDGDDVKTTISVNLQDFTENALMKGMVKSNADWGTAVVMEVNTGEVKAIANLGRLDDGSYAETYNYALGHAGCGEPGSTFKLVSLMAAMEDGYIDTTDVFDTGNGRWNYKGQTIYDSDYGRGGHGKIDVKRIFEVSSNIGVAKIITKYYEGHEKDFINRIYSFGLNKPLHLGFAGEGVPYIKYPTDANWWGPSLAWISYGYEIKLTPLQTLTFYNAVANNGKMVKPLFVKEVLRGETPVKEFQTEVLNPAICSKETLSKAQDLLKGVCLEGTGKSLQNPYFPIAGKTGTAQVAYDNEGYSKGGRKRYQASFVGYFPADKPQYSAIVVIVGPKGNYYGASVAGPVFKNIVAKVYASFMKPRMEMKANPKWTKMPQIKSAFGKDIVEAGDELKLNVDGASTDTGLVKAATQDNRIELTAIKQTKGQMPDLRGMRASDAIYLLERQGLKVELRGVGQVAKQSPAPGYRYQKGQTTYLYLSE